MNNTKTEIKEKNDSKSVKLTNVLRLTRPASEETSASLKSISNSIYEQFNASNAMEIA